MPKSFPQIQAYPPNTGHSRKITKGLEPCSLPEKTLAIIAWIKHRLLLLPSATWAHRWEVLVEITSNIPFI
jgi:hypothetical protein